MPQQQPSAPEQALPDGAADADQAVAYRPVSPAPAGATAPPQTTTTPGQALQQQLEQARVLYWRKDMSAAATAYQSLSQTYPDNADIWGEAGNFYLNMQQREQAADAYSHAVDLLMQQGQQQRARQLLDVMYRLDEDKARALETRLQQSGG